MGTPFRFVELIEEIHLVRIGSTMGLGDEVEKQGVCAV